MFAKFPYEEIKQFEWKDLHKRFLQISVVEPNPECLEPLGQVWGFDPEKKELFLLHEWHFTESGEPDKHSARQEKR